LVVTDGNGCTDSDTADVLITGVAGPTADADGDYSDNACFGSTVSVTLDGSGSTPGGTAIVSYEWYEGTTPLGTGVTLPYDFAPGSYTVTLTITDGNGCSDSNDADVNINALPAFESFTLSTDSLVLCVGLPATFDITATYSDGPRTLYLDSPGVTHTVTGDISVSNASTNEITGNSVGSGSIEVCYEDSGPCGTAQVCATTINITVDEDEFFIVSNKDDYIGFDIATLVPGEPGETHDVWVSHNANHVYFGLSFCSDPDVLIEYRFDRTHCGGSQTEWTEILPGGQSADILLCNDDDTILDIRIDGGPSYYTIAIWRPAN